MKKFRGALITGAAGGIGYELSRKTAADCKTVVLVDMDESKLIQVGKELHEQFGVEVVALAKDLTASSSADEIFNELREKKVRIDILINNAGIGAFGEFSSFPWEKSSMLLQLNIVTLTHLTRLFAGEMVKERKGYVLNLSSMAAFQPGPLMAVYYASKAYVLSFSQSIARELKGTGVLVTALCPGPTKTNFQKRVGSENSWLSRFNRLASAEEVADYGYRSMMKGKAVAIPGIFNSLIVFMIRLMPRNLLSNIVYRLQKLNRKASTTIQVKNTNASQHKNAA